jgi:hypothetical protein
MKELLMLLFSALLCVGLVLPATAETASPESKQSIATPGSNTSKQGKKAYHHGKGHHKKKAEMPKPL